MRIAVLLVTASLVLAGCWQSVDEQPRLRPPAPGPTSVAPPSTTAPQMTPTAAPAAGAPMADVMKWVGAGDEADGDAYHSVTREGKITQLGQDVAFSTSAGTACMTDSRVSGGALACLVKLSDPPAPREQILGEWVGGWVDFDGKVLTVGSVHGDPGRFVDGNGPLLKPGQSLRFGDFQCRDDRAGLYCVNYANQSAVRLSPSGIEPFGCLQEVEAPPEDVGRQFSC